MERIKVVVMNAFVMGAITMLTVLATAPDANYTRAFLISALIAGAISALREIGEYLEEEKENW